jgi:hypothetical protein
MTDKKTKPRRKIEFVPGYVVDGRKPRGRMIAEEEVPLVKELIIDAYRTAPSLRSACAVADCPASTAYYWKNSDEDFAEALLEAREEYRDYLRDMAQKRAEGIEKIVIYKGEVMYRRDDLGNVMLDGNFEPIVLTEIVHSDRILEALMMGNLPEHKRSGGGIGMSIGGGDGRAPTTIEVHFQEPPDWDNVQWDPETGRPMLDVTPPKEPDK